MSATYPQPKFSWQICPLPQQLHLCVISMLYRKLFEKELHKMCGSIDCISSGPTSDPPCRPALLSKIHTSLDLKSCIYTDTGSDMTNTPSRRLD